MAGAYDSWTPMQQRNYHPDGRMKEEYRNWLMANGTSLFETLALEARQQREVKAFAEREQLCRERFGATFGEMVARRSGNLTPAQRQKQQQLALEEGADLSELPYHMEPEDYYDYHGGYPG